MRNIQIDRIQIVIDFPDNLIDERFLPFEKNISKGNDDIKGTIYVKLADSGVFSYNKDEQPDRYETDFAISELFKDKIYCFFKDSKDWIGLAISDNQVCCVPGKEMHPDKDQAAAIFDFMKGGVFLLLKNYGYYVLHSSSVIINEKVLAFSAESGVGKSTHTAFWESLFHTPIFNGDMVLVDSNAETPQAIGIPWSGSTCITTTDKLPLAGVLFIERGPENKILEVQELEKLILFTQRMLSVNYNHKAFVENASKLSNTTSKLKCAKLICRPEEDAAIMANKYIKEHNWI